MTKALPEAEKLWVDPTDLIDLWTTQTEKHKQESYIASKVGSGGIVVDCGCGVGRYAGILQYEQYYGFDSSIEMVRRAKALHPNGNFSCVDIFRFSSDREYDTCLLIDVAYHQEDPIQSLKVIMNNWDAKRYLMTILVGPEDEQLLNSTVISQKAFEAFAEDLRDVTYYSEPMATFDWVLLDISK